MNRNINKSRAIAYGIEILALILIFGVWPFGYIHRKIVVESTIVKSDISESDIATEEHKLAQVFVSEGSRLNSIDIYISEISKGESIHFDILDREFNSLYHKEFEPENNANPGYVHIPVRLDLERGVPYIYAIYGTDNGIRAGLEDHFTTNNTALFTVNYDGGEDTEHNICTRFDFSTGFTLIQTAIIDLIVILISIILVLLVGVLYNASLMPYDRKGVITVILGNSVLRPLCGRFADKKLSVQCIVRTILNPIVIVFTVISLYIVFPRCTFSDKPYNIVFGYISIIMLSVLLLYWVNYKRDDKTTNDVREEFVLFQLIKPYIRGIITAIAIAEVIWHCFEYMNGLYDIFHYYSARRVLIWFLIVIISTFDKDELLNIFNMIWLIVGPVVGYFYSKPYFGMQEEELLYKLNAGILYVGGFVAINVLISVYCIITQKINPARFQVIYTSLYGIFAVGLVILANTRWWPGYLFAILLILIFRLSVWKDRDKWLEYLCDGITLNFIAMVVFSLMHRPYYGYIYHRYNMVYFTVTMTATHLTLSVAATYVRLLIRSRKVQDKRVLIPDMILFGMSLCYLILTLSRTGYASVILLLGVGLVLEWILSHSIKRIGQFVAIILLSVVYMFPVTFTATRMIPALVDDPVIYDYEHCFVSIYKGEEPDNEYYMDIHRFIQVFESKVLNVGDTVTDASDSYIEYNPQHMVYLASAGNDKSIFVLLDDMWDVSDADTKDEELSEDEDRDESNGRIDIFRSYIKQTNLWGHDKMGAILDDGEEASHAHNIYLQVMYDHGLIYGIYFCLFLLSSWLFGILGTLDKRLSSTELYSEYNIFVPIMLTGFMTAGMVEWIFHPCNPYGLAVCMALAAMLFWNDVAIRKS